MYRHSFDGIQAEGLEFRYSKSAPPIVAHFSHHFLHERVTSIVGASGRGKSTLLYILAGVLTPQAGTVSAHGITYSELADRERSMFRARHFGFVFQDALLDSARTVLDNVCESGVFAGMNRTDSSDRARSLLNRFGLSTLANHLPAQISGGQAQRAALCRALLTKPTVILADEPTGNLDQETAERVFTSLSEVAEQGATVIIATHSIEIATQSDVRLDLDHMQVSRPNPA